MSLYPSRQNSKTFLTDAPENKKGTFNFTEKLNVPFSLLDDIELTEYIDEYDGSGNDGGGG